jgi:hypothetical protein
LLGSFLSINEERDNLLGSFLSINEETRFLSVSERPPYF